MQINFCQIIHVMTKFGLQNVMCDHGVEKFTFHFHTVILKNKNIILDILSDFH